MGNHFGNATTSAKHSKQKWDIRASHFSIATAPQSTENTHYSSPAHNNGATQTITNQLL